MSYQVFARKWRPQVFEEVIGQEHITETLKNALLSERLAHAYLFSGTRGVGKTLLLEFFQRPLIAKTGMREIPATNAINALR